MAKYYPLIQTGRVAPIHKIYCYLTQFNQFRIAFNRPPKSEVFWEGIICFQKDESWALLERTVKTSKYWGMESVEGCLGVVSKGLYHYLRYENEGIFELPKVVMTNPTPVDEMNVQK